MMVTKCDIEELCKFEKWLKLASQRILYERMNNIYYLNEFDHSRILNECYEAIYGNKDH